MLCALPPRSGARIPESVDESGQSPLDPSPVPLTDAELMARVANGRREALSQLYERYASLLLALALRILHNRQDAEEVVQEVFIYAWRRARSYDPSRSSVSSWLVVITRSRSLDRLRSARRLASMQAEVERVGDSSATPPAEGFFQVLTEQRAERLRRALSRLPPPQRQVLEYSYYRGWTQKQVAERTGVPIGTVKTRTFLAMKKLRRELSDDIRQLM